MPVAHTLDRLRTVHREIIANLDELAGLLANDSSGDTAYVATRWHLTRASRERWSLLKTEVFPLLREAGAWTPELQQLEDDGAVQQETSTRHLARWPLRAAISDWSAYQAASKRMRAGMRDRLAREAAILYPALRRLSEEANA